MGTASLSASYIGSTTATIKASASGWTLPEGDDKYYGNESNGSTVIITYSNLVYQWTIDGKSATGSSPSVSISGLSAGSTYKVSASVTVSCTETITETNWWTDSSGNVVTGTPIVDTTTGIYVGEAHPSIIVYTAPSSFVWEVTPIQGSRIAITANDWNTLCNKLTAYNCWKNQSGSSTNYSSAKMSADDRITAAAYNTLANALGVSTVVAGKTLITAKAFTDLSDAYNAKI